MATLADWISGARPRTLPAAVTPVFVGIAIALPYLDGWGRRQTVLAALTLLVALALQVGVNYANDYSDGVRGTDSNRVGPKRLVGSGTVPARQVKIAAFACFGVAAAAGLVAVGLTQQWWLVALGAASIAAAWFYTGGSRPYGYRGWGEVFVFVFFGLVAVLGTIAVLGVLPAAWLPGLVGAVSVGAIACAILVANNLRDIVGDRAAGKHTLATRLGDSNTRLLYVAAVGVSVAGVVVVSALTSSWLLLGLLAVVPLWPAVHAVRTGALGPRLITVLKLTGQAELVLGLGVLIGALIARA